MRNQESIVLTALLASCGGTPEKLPEPPPPPTVQEMVSTCRKDFQAGMAKCENAKAYTNFADAQECRNTGESSFLACLQNASDATGSAGECSEIYKTAKDCKAVINSGDAVEMRQSSCLGMVKIITMTCATKRRY